MIRLELRQIGAGAFVAAVVLGLASCSGGNSTVSTSPSAAPTPTQSGTTPTPVPPTPTPSTPPTGNPTPTPTTTGAEAIIDFTGSFQFGPFSIDQFSNGVAIVTQQTGQTRQVVPTSIVGQFFRDLRQNLPVDKIPIGTCPKPTAPPTDITTITFQNATSGDVSCPGNHANTKQLYRDVLAIETALDLRSLLRRRHLR